MRALLDIGKVALLLVGGAIALYSSSCSSSPLPKISTQNLMTERSENMKIIMSKNGRPSYRFETPLIEGYTLAREPYREFREGIKIITYKDDSLTLVDATLTSKYAIYYENSQLWEARGDVVAIKSDGRELYTQQLFWDSKGKRIYSNVDTKIVDTTSDDLFEGEGFESDEAMDQWSFRRLKGRMRVDVSTTPTKEEEEQTEQEEQAEDESSEKVGENSVEEPSQQESEKPQADLQEPQTESNNNKEENIEHDQ